jgi:hypothetical protein
VELFIADGNGSFPVFGAEHELIDVPVYESDVEVVGVSVIGYAAHRAKCAAAWSSNCEWYVAIMPEGIAAMHINADRGLFCRKLSWRFLEVFVDLPKHRLFKSGSGKKLTGRTSAQAKSMGAYMYGTCVGD